LADVPEAEVDSVAELQTVGPVHATEQRDFHLREQ